MLPINPKTLVVDDEANIRYFLQTALQKRGHIVTQAASGEQALELLREAFFDVAILDLNLGGRTDGLHLLEAIRWRWPATVVIILTGQGSLESAMSAIQEGVDGYLLKPVEADEIRKAIEEAVQRARRRAVSSEKAAHTWIEHAGLRLDTINHQVEVDGRPVELTAFEFRLLAYMVADPVRTFSAGELVRVVQQYEPASEQESRVSIKWYIYRLRQKIEADPAQPRYLLNVRGVGYRLGK